MCVDIKLNELLCYRKTTETIYSIESHLQKTWCINNSSFFFHLFAFFFFLFPLQILIENE